MERVTLDFVNIKGLFGRFDYNIDLRNGEDISILIAPNGCGKTTIFSIITFIFKPTLQGFNKISLIPFDECECILSNAKTVVLKSVQFQRNALKNAKSYYDTFEDHEEYDRNIDTFISRRKLSLLIDGQLIEYEEIIENNLKRLDPDIIAMYVDMDYSDMELPVRYRQEFEQLNKSVTDIIITLKKHNCFLNVNFITADRLHSGNGISHLNRVRYRRMGYDIPMSMDNPIKKAQLESKKRYAKIREAYTYLQSKVKDELPAQYLEVTEPLWNYDEFERRWNQYVDDIEKYYQLGLLDSSETILNADMLKYYYDEKGAFLTVYLAAFAKTLEPLAENYKKLKLFVDIFNERNRITKKTIKYGKKGIILDVDGTELSLEFLSSGEKNDFIMFYNLIFNSDDNGLVLIDEPEISLHIEWQQTFMDSLIDICRMNGLQSIVATHSPNIIHGHRELFAERGIEYGAEED